MAAPLQPVLESIYQDIRLMSRFEAVFQKFTVLLLTLAEDF